MSKHFNVTLIVPLITTLFFMMYFIYYWQEELVAYEDFVLQKQINYAADAAVDEMLYTGDLGTDYATTYTNVQPDLGVNEFCIVLLESMEMPTTETNIKWLEDHYIKSIIVCAYDGLYVYDEKEYSDNLYKFVASPKIPYFYTEGQTQYTLNFGYKEGYSDGIRNGNYTVNAIDNLPASITVDRQQTAINNMVSYYLQESVARAYGGRDGKSVMLPAFASEISGAQPIKNISLIGIVDTDNGSKSKPNLCMAVGGARIVDTDPIVGFTINGVKYYAKQSKAANLGVSQSSIIRTFVSEYDAAREGFNCWLIAYE